jgi:hypothetical protein
MLPWPNKDPNEVLDFNLDWANPLNPRLVQGETLLTSEWTIIQGTVVMGNGNNGALAASFAPSGLSTVWLIGGADGEVAILNNKVTTSAGRTYEQLMKLRVREH